MTLKLLADVTEEMLKVRRQELEGVNEWVWPLEDEGAWEGPSQEFGMIRDRILKYSRGRNLIVQAGGCCGMYPRLFANHFDKVVTFEPAPLNYHCLVKNCPDEKIIKYNAAVGDLDKKVFLNIAHLTNVGMNSISGEGTGVEVEQMTIDALNLEACDAIQFDLEGYEAAALLGAAQTIARYQPMISLESKIDTDASVMLLESWGYKKVDSTTNDTQYVPTIVP